MVNPIIPQTGAPFYRNPPADTLFANRLPIIPFYSVGFRNTLYLHDILLLFPPFLLLLLLLLGPALRGI